MSRQRHSGEALRAEKQSSGRLGNGPGLLFSAFLHTPAFLKIRVTDPELHGEVLERFRETFQITRIKADFFLKTVLLAYLTHLNAVPAAPPEVLARFIASFARTQFYDILVPELASRRGGRSEGLKADREFPRPAFRKREMGK